MFISLGRQKIWWCACVPVPSGRYITRVISQPEKHIRKLLLRCGLDGNVNTVFVWRKTVTLGTTCQILQSINTGVFDRRKNIRLIAFCLQKVFWVCFLYDRKYDSDAHFFNIKMTDFCTVPINHFKTVSTFNLSDILFSLIENQIY